MPLERKPRSGRPKKPEVLALLSGTKAANLAEPAVNDQPLSSNSSHDLRRKVLVIEDEPSIRNVLYVLLAGLGLEGDIAHNSTQALAMVSRQSFDAVLLDVRCSVPAAEQVVAKIREVRPSLLGRVLVITGEVADPETLEFLERYALPHVPRDRMLDEMPNHLRMVLGFSHEH